MKRMVMDPTSQSEPECGKGNLWIFPKQQTEEKEVIFY